MKKFVFALALLMVLSGCGKHEVNPQQNDDMPIQTSSANKNTEDTASSSTEEDEVYRLAFSAQTLDGETVDQSIFENARLNIVNLWATYCSPCIEEMPDLGELAQDGGTDYQIIGICADLDGTDETLQLAKDIVSETGANYTHLQPSESLLPVLTASNSVPVTFFFDSEGAVVGQGILGARDKETWQNLIADRLAEVDAADKTDDAASNDTAATDSTEESTDAEQP